MAWPTTVATDTDLHAVVNNLSTTLDGAIDAVTTTVVLTDASLFPTTGGFVTIGMEAIQYTGVTGNSLDGVTRGADGTVAASHADLAPASLFVVAAHHNVLKDEFINLETDLEARIGIGISGVDTPLLNAFVQVNVGGSTLGVDGTLTVRNDSDVAAVTLATESDAGTFVVRDSSGSVVLQFRGDTRELGFVDPSGSFSTALIGPSLTADVKLTLPDSEGTAGQVLSTDGNSPAILSWVDASAGSLTFDSTAVDITAGAETVILVDATAGNRVIALPAAATASGKFYHIKKTDASANTVTINPDGAETIDGAATLVLTAQYQSYQVLSDGLTWHIL